MSTLSWRRPLLVTVVMAITLIATPASAAVLFTSPASQVGLPSVILRPVGPAREGWPLQLTLTLSNAANVGGYETLLTYDTSRMHVGGLRQRDGGLRSAMRDQYSLGPVDVIEGTAFGAVTCPVADCATRSRKSLQQQRGNGGTIRLATITLVPDTAGRFVLGLAGTKVVDTNGDWIQLARTQTVTVDVAPSRKPGDDIRGRGSLEELAAVDRSPLLGSATSQSADVSGDGFIDGADVAEATMAWTDARQRGKLCGAGQQPALDVLADSCLDIGDIQRVAAAFGGGRRDVGHTAPASGVVNVAYPGQANVALALRPMRQVSSPWVVNTTSDADDAVIDGVCTTAVGVCSLRAAIRESNAQVGPNTIHFSIPGPGVKTIQLAAQLPTLTDLNGPLTIDGYTQPGAAPNTNAVVSNAIIMIEIAGAGAGGFDGIRVSSPDNTIRGLAFYRFHKNIWISNSGGKRNIVVGNFIGLRANGTGWHDGSRPSGWGGAKGITMSYGAQRNRVGGTTAAERNVVSGNANDGVDIANEGTDNNVVYNNLAGLGPNGTTRVTNWADGVDINFGASNNVVGGLNPGERNVLSGNDGDGIEISHDPSTAGNQVIGNYIGVDAAGRGGMTTITRNKQWGITFEDGVSNNTVSNNIIARNVLGGMEVVGFNFNATGNRISDNRIGIDIDGVAAGNTGYGIRLRYNTQGATIGPNNVIANSTLAGVYVWYDTSDFNKITQNSIYANGGLGIDLDPDGVNENDQYPHTGPNERLNYPVLTQVAPGSVQGTACPSCVVEVFLTDGSADTHGEGRTYLGSTTTDGSGGFSLAVPGLLAGQVVTATATDPSGNTSEFARNVVAGGVLPTATSTPTSLPPTVTSTPTTAPATLTPTAILVLPTATSTATVGPGGRTELPGRVQVEDYNSGGQQVGYYDTTAGNSGGKYRTDDVDIQTCSDPTTTPCYNVGYIVAGEWLKYDVNVATTGDYVFTVRAATLNTGRRVRIEVDGVNVTGSLTLPVTGGYQQWGNVSSLPVRIEAGAHQIRIVAETASFNLNYFTVAAP